MYSLPEEPKYLDISKISRGFSITITKEVIKYFDIEHSVGKEIAFCKTVDGTRIILVANQMQGGEIFIAASKLSKQNGLVIPDPIRKILNLDIGNIIQFWLEPDRRISIKKTEITY